MTAPKRVVIFLCLGLAAASQSGNIIRLGDAHPLALAAWRLLIASCLLAPLAGRDLGRLRTLTGRERLLLGAAGLALAAHFFTWIASVQLTTVANAAVFFSINPVITATAGLLVFGERIGRRLLVSIGVGIAGVAVIGGGDLSFRQEHLAGDGLAIVCSFLFTVYILLGKRLRRVLPTTAYVTAIYGVAAAASFACVLCLGLPLTDYSPRTWLCFFLLALFPTMIGHTSINSASHYIHAGKIATATLSEPLLAGAVAYFAWNEAVAAQTAIGYAMICLSVLVLVSDYRRADPTPAGRVSAPCPRSDKDRRCTL